jgi:hypothetical protein
MTKDRDHLVGSRRGSEVKVFGGIVIRTAQKVTNRSAHDVGGIASLLETTTS